jgi:hypothetical protein
MGYLEWFIVEHQLSDVFVLSPERGNDYLGFDLAILVKHLSPAILIADILVEIDCVLKHWAPRAAPMNSSGTDRVSLPGVKPSTSSTPTAHAGGALGGVATDVRSDALPSGRCDVRLLHPLQPVFHGWGTGPLSGTGNHPRTRRSDWLLPNDWGMKPGGSVPSVAMGPRATLKSAVGS